MSVTINTDVEIEIEDFLRQADDLEETMGWAKNYNSSNAVMEALGFELEDVLGGWDENEVLEWVRNRKTSQWIVDELDTEVPEVNGLEVLTFIKKADHKYKLMILKEILSGASDVK